MTQEKPTRPSLSPEEQARFDAAMNQPVAPVDEMVQELWQGTPAEPGLGLITLLPLIALDSNGDGRLTTDDEDIVAPSEVLAGSVDIDLAALGRGMLAIQQQVALHFDSNADQKFSANEFAEFARHIMLHFDALEVPEIEHIRTADVLEAYEQNLNRDLPILPRDKNEPQR